jgi:hypothetical protein
MDKAAGVLRTLTVGWQSLLVAVFAVLFGGALYAQDIQIRVLDGRTGHPVSDCLNIWTSPGQREPLVVRAGKDGVAVLHTSDDHAAPVRGHSVDLPCTDVPTAGSVTHVEMIGISPDWDIDCRVSEKTGLTPADTKFYSVDEILRSGIATDNICGKFRTEPKRGELVFYVRPPHWWESLRR